MRCLLKVIFLITCSWSSTQGFLDVTMVINNPVVAYNEPGVLKCVSDLQHFQDDYFPFSVNADVGSGANLTEERVYERIEPEIWPGYQLKIPSSAGALKYGLMTCTVRDNVTNEEASATGVLMSKNALVFPISLSYRASINSSVTMAVLQARQRGIRDLFWFRIPESGVPSRAAQGRLRMNIERVTKKREGPYLIFYQVRDNTLRIFQQGITRLLVRDCIEDRYGENCTQECPPCENGGICDDKNGTCICPPGFMGEWCEIGCGPNRFGRYCQHLCSENEEEGCKDKLFCLPDPFGCACGVGFSGTICSYECQGGSYGHNCVLPCHCIDNKCDRYTGNCTVGCSSGWTGINCQVECANGTYGSNCNETCGFCSGGEICDRLTGFCPETQINETSLIGFGVESNISYCVFGFRPPRCKEGCLNGTWGLDCRKRCYCLNTTECDIVNGFCQLNFDDDTGKALCEPGWRGEACNETCLEGFYGDNCEVECANCKDEKPCHHISGACFASRGECEPGYEGWKCDEACSDGFFGDGCAYVCNCANGTSCEAVTGECDGFCQAGWTGIDCHEACPSGTYGLNCTQECGNCNSVSSHRRLPPCDPRSGKCTTGCTKAWSGDRCTEGILCDINPCSNDGTCLQTGDYYSCQCSSAYSGAHCEIINPPCSSEPCLNNGICADTSARHFRCTCTEDYEGETCEIDKRKKTEAELTTPSPPPGGEGKDNNENSGVKKEDENVPKDETGDISIIIIAAMCLVAVVLISAIALALKSCSKKQISVSTGPLGSNPPDLMTQQPFESLPSMQTNMKSESSLQKRLDEPSHMNDSIQEKRQESFSFQKIEQEQLSDTCSPSTSDTSPLTTTDSQEESIAFTETTPTSEKLSDFIEAANENATCFSPFSTHEEIPVEKAPSPPSGPSDISIQSLTINRKPPKRRFSRTKVQLRFSKNSLDRLEEISGKNCKEDPDNIYQQPNVETKLETSCNEPKKLSRIPPAKIFSMDPWDPKSSGKVGPNSVVFGVAHRDVNMLITSPRNADEEFEMESRKGPVTERKKPTRSVVINAK